MNAGMLFGAILTLIGVAVVLLTLLVRWWFARSAEERAFWWLARRAGLRRSARSVVRSLADAHGRAHPVALLLSERVFVQAVAAAKQRGLMIDRVDSMAIEAVRVRVFSGQ